MKLLQYITNIQTFFFFFLLVRVPILTTKRTYNGHESMRTGPLSTGRRWPGLKNYVLHHTSHLSPRGKDAVFDALGNVPGILDVALTWTTNLNIIADYVHLIIVMNFSIQQENVRSSRQTSPTMESTAIILVSDTAAHFLEPWDGPSLF